MRFALTGLEVARIKQAEANKFEAFRRHCIMGTSRPSYLAIAEAPAAAALRSQSDAELRAMVVAFIWMAGH